MLTDQFTVMTSLHQTPTVEHQHLVGTFSSRKPVSNGHRRPTLGQLVNGVSQRDIQYRIYSRSSFVEHQQIVEAMGRRDAEQAESLMRYHIRASRLNVEKMLAERKGDELS